jgi:hypothetical protein
MAAVSGSHRIALSAEDVWMEPLLVSSQMRAWPLGANGMRRDGAHRGTPQRCERSSPDRAGDVPDMQPSDQWP